MTVNLSFAEISEYVRKHYGKVLSFSKVSEKEIRIAYEQRILIRTVQIPVNIIIDEVHADSVAVTYKGGFGIDTIISGVIIFLKAKVPELSQILVSEEGHRIRIELSKLKQTEKLVNAVNLQDICVRDSSLEVKASLK